jgi:hypothetical protein
VIRALTLFDSFIIFRACGYYGYYYILIILVDNLVNGTCSFDYGFIMWGLLGGVLGVGPCFYLVDWIGRVGTQFVGFVVGVFAGMIFASMQYNLIVITSTAFFALAAIFLGLSATWLHTAELFPTKVY